MNHLIKTAFFLSALFLISCSAEPSKKIFEITGKTMGTTYSVKLVAPQGFDKDSIATLINQRLIEVNRQMSTYIKTSEISQFNRFQKAEDFPISDWFGQTLELSLRLAKQTEGAFDPTIGPLVNLWGFGPQKHQSPPSDAQIAKAQSQVGFEKLILNRNEPGKWSVSKKNPRLSLDLSASAKGFGVDVLSQLLNEKGYADHLVEIGGELRASGSKMDRPWIVAIERPLKGLQRSVQEVIELNNLSLATSGNYRNFFKSEGKVYPHSIDRVTGKPVQSRLLSVSVLSMNCGEADALATALMVMGENKARAFAQKQKLAALFIVADAQSETAQAKVFRTPEFEKFRRDL